MHELKEIVIYLCPILLTDEIHSIKIIHPLHYTSINLYMFTFRALKFSPFLRGVEDVAIECGQKTEEKQIEQQFPVNELVEGTAPHKQEPGEPTAGGTGDLVLIRDRHLLSEHRASFFSRTMRPRARCYSYFQKLSSVEPEREIVQQLQTAIGVRSLEYFTRDVAYNFSPNDSLFI